MLLASALLTVKPLVLKTHELGSACSNRKKAASTSLRIVQESVFVLVNALDLDLAKEVGDFNKHLSVGVGEGMISDHALAL